MNETEKIMFDKFKEMSLPTSKDNIQKLAVIKESLKRNKNTPYTDTAESKEQFFQDLYSKIDTIKNTQDEIVVTSKNLVYFSIFLSDDYIDILDTCLQSIIKNTPIINFDLLFITDATTKEKLSQLNVLQKFNTHYYVLEEPVTYVDASINKLNIFNWPEIDSYSKVLYLDCDILCVKNLNEIFTLNILPGILYTGKTRNTKYSLLTGPILSLMYLTDRDAEYLAKNHKTVEGFNAGQFLFINSFHMKKHFENVLWMSSNWPSDYFYEQSLMNHYFVFNNFNKTLKDNDGNEIFSIVYKHFTEPIDVLERIKKEQLKKVPVVKNATRTFCPTSSKEKENLINITFIPSVEFDANEKTILMHFAVMPGNGVTKRAIIEKYKNANML